ncbi:GDP-fucose protein O-fucosyltransferase protein [Dioscorea alata]|uniref:GDP-fucose protein O-fucosyltransferase protein n=2 Tax=Dioscorea alata TaxID=55571 RepID=A0ACB7V079_DIOAL|nr:GDP-fucose protein O-fucosyltransferase protein [Dioscorea alata]KAH7666717.1 GDP-fucose protein O-fucosyltransferase protein [Dioscorea alata]
MVFKNKIKLAAFVGIALSVASLLVHLLLADYSTGDLIRHKVDDFYAVGPKFRNQNLWGPVKSLDTLQPFATPRNSYPGPNGENGFIYAKIFGGFDSIRSAICDLVTIARLLNATLVIPEIQQSLRSKSISTKFKSFSYIYNEEQFIAALSNDVVVVKSLPDDLKDARKQNKLPVVSPRYSTATSYYIGKILPRLKESKAVGLMISYGGCLESILPPNMAEYQRLRCRVAFHALQFRPEILALGNRMVERLRGSGRPYMVFHPGLVRDTLAFHGCAELFQDVHTELIQYRRSKMIEHNFLRENLSVNSMARKRNGSCPIMPEEVGLILRAMGYHPNTIIYLAGSEIFGGQRVLIPLRAMYLNLVDRTSLCSKKELSDLLGPETSLPLDLPQPPPEKSKEQLIKEWKKAGPRPRPLPPPPARPFYRHEKEGWYGWVAETDKEPEPSRMDLRLQAHRLIWDALDYLVSVEADAFIPGFHNDGSGWPDFSSLVMGHRLYQMAYATTYRPDRKTIAELLESIRGHLYHPKRNWTATVREHLNNSLGVEGLTAAAKMLKPRSFISHPLPECSCRLSKPKNIIRDITKGRDGELLYGGEPMCPDWLVNGMVSLKPPTPSQKDDVPEDNELPEDDPVPEGPPESDSGSRSEVSRSSEQDEEMDPDD